MQFLLTKILTQLVSPLSLSLLLAVLAGLIFWHERKKLGGVVLFVAIAWLWLWSAPVFTHWVGATVEGQFPPVPVEELDSADAIVVLGGGVSAPEPPRLYPEVSAAGDRILHAARLYKAGKSRWIIASGWRGTWSKDNIESEASAMRVLLKELGVPEEAVLIEEDSRNTRENAKFTKRLLDLREFNTILLVTSALHMPRAMAEFSYICSKVYPAPTDFEIEMNRSKTVLDWMPDAGALAGGSRAFKEILGRVTQVVTTKDVP